MNTPPTLPAVRVRDVEQTRLLAVFHFVLAALCALGLGFLLLHYAFMHALFAKPEAWKGAAAGPPAEFFAIFKLFYVAFAATGVGLLVLNLLSGIFLLRRRHRMFSLVVSGLNCLQIPFGTILGVFTLIVLMRESVGQAYSDTKTP